ncbi:LOW QUALITY PROTEIN: protein phosphatase PHLPP-like protein [Anopheles maculipalpis]|uniref:LOW QUALITY PROTEIN: protein phosphatase PHLPP-like protein n=1 Tax=Anopheles maculipalpis TaxID=1496333 RepID=UPI002158D4B8|nr:LOW QUALITY PROTEIN: protein phosphatase PHLPP-like protein [Anopheles maculipalpis]
MTAAGTLLLLLAVVKCIPAVRLKCDDRVCIVYNLRSSLDSFVYRYFPKKTDTLVHKHLQVEHADRAFLEDIQSVSPIESVVITDSDRLVRISIAGRFNASSLTITHTSLTCVDVEEENHQLQQLLILNSKLTSVPKTIDQLQSLVTLRIKNCLLVELDLTHFCLMPKLYYLDVRNNRISTVIRTPAKNDRCDAHVVYIYLVQNKLSSVNMTMFDDFARLRYLDLCNNLLQSLTGSFVAPVLEDLRLANNNLTTLSFCHWYVPQLSRIIINKNALINVPECLANVANASDLVLCSNKISTVKLDSFAMMDKLLYLDVCWNRLTSVILNSTNYPSSLATINLSYNRLTQLDLSWVPLRNLLLMVNHNFISRFDVSKVSCNVTRCIMTGNPIDCSWSDVPDDPGASFTGRASVQCVQNGD